MTGALQRQFVAVCPKPKQAATRDIAKVAVMPKLLPGKCIAQVNFDKRNLNREKRITQCDARVRKCTRVQDDEVDPVACSLLHAIDEFVFGVALVTNQRVPEGFGRVDTASLDVFEAVGTIDLWLS